MMMITSQSQLTGNGSSFADQRKRIDETVAIVQGLFNEIRITRRVPLAEIRNLVIPNIRECAGNMPLVDLFASLQSNNDYLYRHSVAVGALSLLLGKWLGMPEAEQLQLTTAAFLHDIGKTMLPVELLKKPDKLSEDEFTTMKRHTLIGYEMMKKTVGTTHRQALVALQHHERMNGMGYPFGMIGDQIDMFSRIVAVADTFHAMMSKTEYRNPSPMYEVLTEMENQAYGSFDPTIVGILIRKFMQALIGYEVVLTDGSKGKIVMINPHHTTRPLVQIGGEFLDLSKHFSIQIEQVE